MRGMQQQLGNLGPISAFACRHRKTKKPLCRDGRSQDLPDTDFQPAVCNTMVRIIILYYNITLQYHCVTVVYSFQYSNMLYRFVAQEKQAIPYSLGVQQAILYCLGKYTFAQRRNRLTTYFAERIPIIKRCAIVFSCRKSQSMKFM